MPPKKKGLALTPGLQDLITEVNDRHARGQEAAAAADEAGGVPLLGQIFNGGSDFVADRVGDVVQGGAYILNTMDLSRKWVAQPILGAMTATVAGQWDEVQSYSDLRTVWEESKVPGPIKFIAEMGMDPLLWTGWGWAHTAPVKFAKALTPLVMGGKTATRLGGIAGPLVTGAPARVLETVYNPIRMMTARTYQIGKAEFAFSDRARKAITALSKGELKTPREINNLVKESVKLGYVPKNPDAVRQATEMIRAGSGSFGRALGPGWVARLAEPLRMNRLLSPMDVLFENMWMAPFGAAAPLLVPAAKAGGMLAVKAIDATGKTFPMKSALWLGARVGPEIGHDAYAAAAKGRLASWVFQPTTRSLEREATRTMGRVRTMFGQAKTELGLGESEVLSAFRFSQDDVIRRLGLDDGSKDIMRAVLEPSEEMTDDVFQELITGGRRGLAEEAQALGPRVPEKLPLEQEAIAAKIGTRPAAGPARVGELNPVAYVDRMDQPQGAVFLLDDGRLLGGAGDTPIARVIGHVGIAGSEAAESATIASGALRVQVSKTRAGKMELNLQFAKPLTQAQREAVAKMLPGLDNLNIHYLPPGALDELAKPPSMARAKLLEQADVVISSPTMAKLNAALSSMDIAPRVPGVGPEKVARVTIASVASEQQVLDGIHLGVQRHLRRNLVSLEKAAPEALTAVNRFWGWTHGLVQRWKPWVTSRMPHFWPLNTIDNIGRGGTGLTKASMNEVKAYMVKHGYPEDLVTHVTPSVFELMKKGIVAPADLAAMSRGLRTTAVSGEKIVSQAAPLTQLGIEQSVKKGQTSFGALDRVARNMHAGVLRQDQNAQIALAELGTSRGLLRDIMTAPVEDDVYRLRQLIGAKRAEGNINPALLDEMEKIAVKAVDDPVGMSKVINEQFSLPAIHLSEVENSRWFNSMPEGWQDAFKGAWEEARVAGIPSIQSLSIATNKADGLLPQFLGARRLKYVEGLTHREDLLDGIFADMGIQGLKAARQETQRTVRNVLEGTLSVLEEANPKAATYFKGRMGPIADAVRGMDHVTYSHIAQAAQRNGMTSQYVLPAFESWNQRMPKMIADRVNKLAGEMDVYRKAMVGGKELAAQESLLRMAEHHGDFSKFATAAEKPIPEMVEQQFRVTSEGIWNQFVGGKFEMADALIALYQRGKVINRDVTTLLQKGTKDLFRIGNVAQRNERWSHILSRWSETEGIKIPVNTKMRQQEILTRRRELQTELQNRVPFGQDLEEVAKKDPVLQGLIEEEATLTAEYTALRTPRADIEKELKQVQDAMFPLRQEERHMGVPRGVVPELNALREEERRLLALLADPTATGPVRPIEEMYRDFLNNYEQLGRGIVNAAASTNPREELQIYRNASAQLRGKLLKMSVNEPQDLHGIKAVQEYFQQVIGLGKDQRLRLRLSNMTRNALQKHGMPFMRQRMVDYTRQVNLHEIVGSFLPFAAFQLHMPGYLARSFMERPGYIQMMNHFAQSAEENFGVTGGMVMGEGFVFAPHLRFSYLPIMAGNNFVRGDDHPVNQLNDMLSLFGLSPGPNVMVAADLANGFADKSGFTEKLGIEQAAPEFRGGLLPQWRFVQDITAMMGIDSGKGLNIPWIGPSVDIREREVKRVLAGRLGARVEAFRERNGRDPYPDEVTDMREFVQANEIADARREVAARDIPAAFIPGLKPHDPEYTRIRERAAAWMTTQGIEKVTAKNVVAKYRKLTKFQKVALTRLVPEFGDVLAVPPFQESGQDKDMRQAKEGFFRNRDLVMATVAQEQRKLDTALEAGNITPVQYRHMRSGLRTKMSAGLDALEQNPEFSPFITMERQVPTEPQEMAYMDYQKMEPQDANQNGIIDEDDMRLFFDARRTYLQNQPPWVRDYVRTRRELQMTPTEIEYTRAQTTLNDFYDIPKYLGLSQKEGEAADKVLEQARALARLAPGRTNITEVVMQMPSLSNEERVLALRALRAGRNPQRFAFWTTHAEDLEQWYPDLKPANPLEQA